MAINHNGQRIESVKEQQMRQSRGRFKPMMSGGTGTILYCMYKDIEAVVCPTLSQWEYLMFKYLNDQRNSIPNNVHGRSSARGNLRKELNKPKMSWRVFCKGMRLLNLFKFEFIIRVKAYNGKVVEFTVPVNLGEAADMNYEVKK